MVSARLLKTSTSVGSGYAAAGASTVAMGRRKWGCYVRFFVDHTTQLGSGALPLGYALGEPVIELLDDDGDAGTSAEIVVRSRQVTLGYWRDEDPTARVMQIDADDHRRRIFRTGDLGMRDADGCLWLTGRADFQVKINGNRVQLDEVEAAVKRIPAVLEAIVIARHDTLEACLVVRRLRATFSTRNAFGHG